MINLNNKASLNRALTILNWIELRLPGNKVKALSRTELHSIFGNTSRSPGKEFKELFLITHDSHYNMNTGSCKTYTRNAAGILWVKQQLGLESFTPSLSEAQILQLDTGDFEYVKKSDRVWNSIQFIPKVIRDPALASRGYRWDYDIEACAPTLLYQYSQRLYQQQWLEQSRTKKLRRSHTFTAVHIEQYISNRSSVRKQISFDCEISQDDIKTVINALFQGSVLSVYPDSKLYKELGSDFRKITALKQNQFLCGLRKEIKQMWEIIKEELPQRYTTDRNGKTKRVALSGRDKSGVYRSLENQVGQVVKGYLTASGNKKLVWLHDGWVCTNRVNSEELVTEIRRTTGYLIRLSERVIEN